jgi:immunity protein, SdpI family
MAANGSARFVVIFVLAFAASAAAYAKLPPGTFSPAFIAFLLPAAALVVYAIIGRVLDGRHADGAAGRDAYDAIVFRVVLFILALHAIVLVGLLGRGLFARNGQIVARLTPFALGAALIAIGNLLPRLRPNPALGIRTSRALTDRGVWLRINRRAGYVAVAMGLALVSIAATMTPGPAFRVALSMALGGGAVALAVVSWRASRA